MTDWWYLRAYPGSSYAMDNATRVLVPWLREQARNEGASRWFFMRYLDMSGQHLRMRLQASPDALDRVHARKGEVEQLLRDAPEPEPRIRLVAGADLGELRGPRVAKTAIYAPELEKYGGSTGVSLSLDLFTFGSTWFDDHGVVDLTPRFERARLAVEFQIALVRAALPLPDDQLEFWKAHQRQWGWQLRMLVPTADDYRVKADEVLAGVRSAHVGSGPRDALDDMVGAIVGTLDAAGMAGIPLARVHLLLNYLHMEMNRWGFMPAEECLIGLLARTTHNDREDAS